MQVRIGNERKKRDGRKEENKNIVRVKYIDYNDNNENKEQKKVKKET